MSLFSIFSRKTRYKTDSTTGPLSVGRFVDRDDTPGNVGVCLSGGGTRACIAGMGQLRALNHLTLNGRSLISQTKALSSVSGGSWVSVPYMFLRGSTTDEDFLDRYVPPNELVVNHGSASTSLDRLPVGNIGNAIASRLFSAPALAVAALFYIKILRVPKELVWQSLISTHLLEPYGLYSPGRKHRSVSSFTNDITTLNDITAANPDLDEHSFHMVADAIDSSRARRPFYICNCSMFVDDKHGNTLAAPVQSTPFFTGIMGTPDAFDANDMAVGGGGVDSFAFDSQLARAADASFEFEQENAWSLMDIIGTSSAFFAEKLLELMEDRAQMEGHLSEHGTTVMNHMLNRMTSKQMKESHSLLGDIKALGSQLVMSLAGKLNIIPEYDYWPIRDASPDTDAKPTQFGDGGILENTGVASLLAYEDIDSIVSFVNSSTRLELVPGGKGIIDEEGNEIPNTNIRIDGQNAYLFGYRDYDPAVGWRLFEADSTDFTSRCRVFEPAEFAAFLTGIWKASGSGSYRTPPVLKQHLRVLQNDWFGVPGGRSITVLWNYTERSSQWYDQLSTSVQEIIGDFEDPDSFSEFPHYSLVEHNHLPTTDINLLSNLTAWSIADPANSQPIIELYK